MPARIRKSWQKKLEALRDRIASEIEYLAGENISRSQREVSGDLSSYSFHMADQGTDNFDREFAINMVSNEQEALYETEEALRRLEDGTFGTCESCGGEVEPKRLEALPFTRHCLKCKSEMERVERTRALR